MKDVLKTLSNELENRDCFFVFPSEVVASFWRKKALSLTRRKAVRSERFQSWDTFKENVFSRKREEKPVNRRIRLLFTASLLEKNNPHNPIFSYLINPEYADSSKAFLKHISSILPSLGTPSVREILEGNSSALNLEEGQRRDLLLILNEYRKFLKENSLFEPSYEKPDLNRLEGKYYIFFPDVIEDFLEFQSEIKNCPFIKVIETGEAPLAKEQKTLSSGGEKGRVGITFFGNVKKEIRWVVNKLRGLLDGGVRPQQIAITVSEEEVLNLLEAQCSLYGIPLDIRKGRSLTQYPAGRLFPSLSACHASDFSMSALKNLLLNRHLPWKNRQPGEELILFGIKYFCSEGAQWWIHNLRRMGEKKIEVYFRKLSERINGLFKAGDFKELKKEVDKFLSAFLDTDKWDEKSLRILQTSLDLLNELISDNEYTGEQKIADPFGLWLKAIEERIYVEKPDTAGIPVYGYRVSAGVYPDYHFITGATHQFTTVTVDRFPFFREDQKKGTTMERSDFSDDFLRLYSLSGKNLYFTCSGEMSSGAQLPPGYFVSRDMVFPYRDEDNLYVKDLFATEERIWLEYEGGKRSEENNPCFSPVQKEGFLNIDKTAFRQKDFDLTRETIVEDHLNEIILSRLSEEEGNLTISHSAFELFRSCPFAYLLSTALEVEEKEWDVFYYDPRIVGQLTHIILRELFNKIKELHGFFLPGSLEEYMETLEQVISECFTEWERKRPFFISPIWTDVRKKTMEALNVFLKAEKEAFPDWKVFALEKTISLMDEEEKLKLTGRIDRISEKEKKKALIDYKKRNPCKRDVLGKELSPEEQKNHEPPTGFLFEIPPQTLQLPFYIYISEARAERIHRASYYGVDDGKYVHIFDDTGSGGWADRDKIDTLVSYTREKIYEMSSKIRNGDYRTLAQNDSCESCSFRRICRNKFMLRLK